MNGHACPECGTDRGAASNDGRPGCGCAERAAEDFSPLRIRPYVTLHGPPETGGRATPPYPEHDCAAAVTRALGVLGGPAGNGPGPEGGQEDGATAAMAAVPLPGAGPGSAFDSEYPSADTAEDLYAFGSGQGRAARRREQRKGPSLWLAVGAAVVAVVGTAAFAGGLFSGSDEQEFALPDIATSPPAPSGTPETSASKGPESAAASHAPGPSATASSPGAATGSAPASAGASPGIGAGSSEPGTATPSSAPSTAENTGTVKQAPEPPAGGAVLSRGDRGPEVAELQDRLAQAQFYNGPDNGQFNDRVEQALRAYQSSHDIQGDPAGTYGPHTRSALEAETREP
ncbi:peptidoglycan-binding protein [Streptomyces sp. NPDC055287]